MRQTINLRQMACMAGVLVFANKVLVLPSLFYGEVGVDGIFMLLGLFAVDILLLMFFFKVKEKYPQTTFFELVSKFLTKYVAYFVYALLCVFFLVKTLSVFNISLMYLKSQVYFEAGEYIFLICFLTITNCMVLKGLRSTARTTEFFYIFIVLMAIFCIFASFSNFEGLPIMFNESFTKIFTSSFRYLFWFGDTLFFFLIMDKIEFKKSQRKTVYIFVLVNMAIVFCLYLIYYSIFRYTGFMHNNAASDVLSVTDKFAAIGRIDIFAVIVIMFLNYLQLAIYNTAFDASFSAVFPKGNKMFSVIIFDVLFLVVHTFLLPNYTTLIWFGCDVMNYFALLLQYIIPLFIFVMSLLKKKVQHE